MKAQDDAIASNQVILKTLEETKAENKENEELVAQLNQEVTDAAKLAE